MYILFTTFNDENKYYNLNLQILPEILLAAYCHLLFCLSAFVWNPSVKQGLYPSFVREDGMIAPPSLQHT